MNVAAHYKSMTAELESLKDRVRNFIQDAHWLTDGEWKESVLRTFLARRLPDTVKVGRGFVLTANGPTTQCDILLYKSDAPILFRDADLVFLTPDAVLGIIEVKTKLNAALLSGALDKFAAIGHTLGPNRGSCFFGLFSYECDIQDETLLTAIVQKCDHRAKILDLVSLGCDKFVKWWQMNPQNPAELYQHWHLYSLTNMAAGYFISNVVDSVSPLGSSAWLWFPEEGKETKRTHAAAFGGRVVQQN